MKKQQYQLLEVPIPDTTDIERQVLADALMFPAMQGDMIPLIHGDFFTADSRRQMWETVVDSYNKGAGADTMTIATKHTTTFQNEIMPKMIEAGVGTDECRVHCALLRDGAASRRAYFAATAFLAEAAAQHRTEADILASAEAFNAALVGPAPLLSESRLADALEGVKADLKAMEQMKAEGRTLRIGSGFRYLDDAINGGFKSGQLVVLAARPSVGKTAVMLQMAKHAAQQGKPVELFSLEMTCQELCERLLFSTGNVKPYQIAFSEIDWKAYARAELELKPLPIYINDFSRSLDDIVSRMTQAVKQGRCQIAFIDYLGLVSDALNTGNAKLYQVLGRITGTLKAVAKRLQIPVVLLCQMNRAQVQERDKNGQPRPPELYDLRDSGSIEQDSDIVLMLDPQKDSGHILMWLRKNRSGKRDIAFEIVPNNTYSEFEERLPHVPGILAEEPAPAPPEDTDEDLDKNDYLPF